MAKEDIASGHVMICMGKETQDINMVKGGVIASNAESHFDKSQNYLKKIVEVAHTAQMLVVLPAQERFLSHAKNVRHLSWFILNASI